MRRWRSFKLITMKISQNEINEHLKNYGYNLIYSFNDEYCSEALLKHLGKGGFKKFWKEVDKCVSNYGESEVEKYIRKLIGGDTVHLKILLSGQIAISVVILESIINEISNDFVGNENLKLLELGGYDGWASDYLSKQININKIDVVDLDSSINQKNSKVFLIESNYSDYRPIEKYDIVFSILGAAEKDFDILLGCIASNIKPNGKVYLGIRIRPDEYDDFVKKASTYKLYKTTEKINTVDVLLATGKERFPVFNLTYNE